VNGALQAAYAISKAGVEQLGRALRMELGPSGASAMVVHYGFIDTQMVRESFADPVAHGFEEHFPRWMTKRLTPAQAAAALVKGLERRAPRVIAPSWWKAWFALRGILNPITDRTFGSNEELTALLRQADADERSTLRGGLERPEQPV
jgi:NAD(P)-dependent dehydrogenase (short-subunit alcohol dehydrogenase family)